MSSDEAKGGVIELAAHQRRRNALGALPPVTKGEVIFTSISVAILLASVTYAAIALGLQ
jgi:hypothetical protein